VPPSGPEIHFDDKPVSQRGYRNGNLHLGENRTIEPLLSGVRRWTALEELREDMAILLARRV
jgi:hypothetical protein